MVDSKDVTPPRPIQWVVSVVGVGVGVVVKEVVVGTVVVQEHTPLKITGVVVGRITVGLLRQTLPDRWTVTDPASLLTILKSQ
jgi:hypothetical protein